MTLSLKGTIKYEIGEKWEGDLSWGAIKNRSVASQAPSIVYFWGQSSVWSKSDSFSYFDCFDGMKRI